MSSKPRATRSWGDARAQGIALLLTALILLSVSCLPLRPSPSSIPLPTGSSTPTAAATATATATAQPTSTFTPVPSPSPTLRPTRTPLPLPPPRPPLIYGVAVHLYELDRGRALDLAREAGFGWVRQQIWWRYLEPWKGHYLWADLDDIVAQAEARDLKVLLSIVRAPGWAAGGGYGLPADPEDLGDLLYAMASRYRGRVQAYEIWNEPNLAHENAGRVVEPERYVDLLSVAYRRIKEADPSARVISAPLTPTGVSNPWVALDDLDYLRAMLAYQDGLFLRSCDAIGVHAAGSNNPPDTHWPERPGPGEWTTHPTFYFRHVEDIHAVLAELGVEKPLWITEFGWATANWTPGYGYGNDNSEEEQAAYIIRAYRIIEWKWPYVEAAFLWNLNFAVVRGTYHEQGAFSILYSDWSPRPAYRAVRRYLFRMRATAPVALSWRQTLFSR